MGKSRNFFHLHLVSDSTGETLMTVARAATAQYEDVEAIEHVYPLVRSARQLEQVISEIEASPGIVLYTLVDTELAERLEQAGRRSASPCVNILSPVFSVFQSYLNVQLTGRVGGQHALDADYFHRIDALNFTMLHDDGQIPGNLDEADVVLLGISRTSKTPTCIYLANRGLKAANIPIVPDIPLPPQLFSVRRAMVVAVIASVERIQQVRQNRILSLNAGSFANDTYLDRRQIAREIATTRKLCAERGWPVIDVTRRSIEETAAEIMSLYRAHKSALVDQLTS
ncbi:kinase/pyrophosphorylase [Stappia taiwanensis]|uniref:Putative pyruvate, phosphate dikinase regulatory protein n=1 Tax=Stappia taiwanensis TaxID=992267 RepID=A0A838Y1Q3_9HYPH|nr:pyruvate, water dikinase regulatory protein [Stappia taiwanensis]MBA4612963.1 kinase/pyrophosphorylase [Stappia taiwanensis]GGF06462.1 putative pyruvate, phosphate dikinase regulatory protein [Stappia taiwanensis]